MFGAALSWLGGFKGWLYGILAAAIIGAGLWVYWHGRSVGADNTSAKYEKLLREAEDKARAIEDSYAKINEDHSRALEIIRSDRDAAYAAAGRNIQPVILRTRACPVVPEIADTPDPTDPASARHELPVRTGGADSATEDMPDIGPELVDLMRSCQVAHDTAIGWQTFWKAIEGVR